MTVAEIRQRKAAKVAEQRAMLAKAETERRQLSADEASKFDALKAEITELEQANPGSSSWTNRNAGRRARWRSSSKPTSPRISK